MILIQPAYYERTPTWRHRRTCGPSSSGCPNNRTFTKKSPSLDLTYRVDETAESYEVIIETPGVKVSDIQVEKLDSRTLRVTAERKQGKEVGATYKQSFVFDPKKIDASDVSAKYENGILTIRMPKIPAKDPVVVGVVAEYPPVDEAGKLTETLVGSLDLPGVKIDAVKVTVKHNRFVLIEATRKYGTANVQTKRAWSVEAGQVESVKAYLKDGVLTITASAPAETKKATENGASNDQAPKRIPIQTPESLEADTKNERAPEGIMTAKAEIKDAESVSGDTIAISNVKNAIATAVPTAEEGDPKDGIFSDAVTVETVDESKLDDY